MPALQARRLRHALVLQVRIAQGEELVGGGTRHRVHEDREVARLRQSSLAAVARAQCQHRADAVVVRCLQKEPRTLECPGHSSSEEASSSAADPAVETTRANSRDMASSRLEHSDADGKVELEQVRRKLVRTSRSAAATKGSWAETRAMGPWCDVVHTRSRRALGLMDAGGSLAARAEFDVPQPPPQA